MKTPDFPTQMVTFVYVSNLLDSHRFYSEVLRLPLVLDQGTCRIYGVTDSAFIGLCTEKRSHEREGIILTLVSNDLDHWYTWLLHNAVSVTKKPTFNETYNITHLFCLDPDGYCIEIQTFHDPRWPSPKEQMAYIGGSRER
ncbi:MAG: VOC family protein [Myxococcota bacterium]|nr:VOC family protein [Myxococcota bacterium]